MGCLLFGLVFGRFYRWPLDCLMDHLIHLGLHCFVWLSVYFLVGYPTRIWNRSETSIDSVSIAQIISTVLTCPISFLPLVCKDST